MSQCNFCGYTEPNPTDLQIGAPPRPVVPCELCGSQICSGCRPNHEVGCRPNAQKKALGVGPTVSSVPYEHRAGHVVPETTPPDRRERITAKSAVLGAPYDLTPEPAVDQAAAPTVDQQPIYDVLTGETKAPESNVEMVDPATADGNKFSEAL